MAVTVKVDVSLNVANTGATLDAANMEATVYLPAKFKSDTLKEEEAVTAVATGVVVDGPAPGGSTIMAYSPWKIVDDSHILVPLERTQSRPASINAHTAVLHAVSLIQASALLQHAPKDISDSKRIVLVGGETPLAAGIVQILKTYLPRTKIYITCCTRDAGVEDQEELFQRVAHLMKLGKIPNPSGDEDVGGAFYAIDGSIPDLMTEYWKSLKDENNGVEFLINAMPGQRQVRADLLELASTVIECHVPPVDIGRPPLDIAEVQRLLIEAAEVFSTEEIPQCSFGDDEAEI